MIGEALLCAMSEEVMSVVDETTRRRRQSGGKQHASLPTPGNYWDGKGQRQGLFDRVWEEHLPSAGVPTQGGDAAKLVYALAHVLHEVYAHKLGNVTLSAHPTDYEAAGLVAGHNNFNKLLGYLSTVSPAAKRIITHLRHRARSQAKLGALQEEDEEEDYDEPSF